MLVVKRRCFLVKQPFLKGELVNLKCKRIKNSEFACLTIYRILLLIIMFGKDNSGVSPNSIHNLH